MSLSQTTPSKNISMCPHSTVEFICTAEYQLGWVFETMAVALYIPTKTENQISSSSRIKTKLLNVTGNRLSSSATIETVQTEHDKEIIECQGISGIAQKTIHVEGI